MAVVIDLTRCGFSDVFADKRHVAPRLSLSNIEDLNRVLRSEVFVSEDGKLRAAYLILGFEPLSSYFQEIGNAIIIGDHRRRRIDISKVGFLASQDLPDDPSVILIERPIVVTPLLAPATTAPQEGFTSLRLSLEEEIDQYQVEEGEEKPIKPINLSDFERKLSRSIGHFPSLIIAEEDSESEDESMAMNPGKSLKALLAARQAGSSS